MGRKGAGLPDTPELRRALRMSCTRTAPSYHPDTITCLEEPHGADGGAPVMPYTAVERSRVEWRMANGVGDSPAGVAA